MPAPPGPSPASTPAGSPAPASGPPIAALVGPTGAGKSAIALDVAAATGATIVAVDAFTVYRGMDIGTATPSPRDQAAVRHRLLDLLDVEQPCTIAWFQRTARAAIDEERTAGRPVLLVGGSGLYFRAVVDDLEIPPTDPAVRASLQARHGADPAAAHALLARLDPPAAGRIDPGNLRRTVRALEVLELTGRPFSSFRTAWDSHRSRYPELAVVGLDRDPGALREAIADRTDAMLAGGWLKECRALADRELSHTAAQAIGYAELLAHLRGEPDLAGTPAPDLAGTPAADLASTRDAIVVRTRRFAARQRRWFRRDPRVRWMAPEPARTALTEVLRGATTA